MGHGGFGLDGDRSEVPFEPPHNLVEFRHGSAVELLPTGLSKTGMSDHSAAVNAA